MTVPDANQEGPKRGRGHAHRDPQRVGTVWSHRDQEVAIRRLEP